MFCEYLEDGILLLSPKLNPREEIFDFYHRRRLDFGCCRSPFHAEGQV